MLHGVVNTKSNLLLAFHHESSGAGLVTTRHHDTAACSTSPHHESVRRELALSGLVATRHHGRTGPLAAPPFHHVKTTNRRELGYWCSTRTWWLFETKIKYQWLTSFVCILLKTPGDCLENSGPANIFSTLGFVPGSDYSVSRQMFYPNVPS